MYIASFSCGNQKFKYCVNISCLDNMSIYSANIVFPFLTSQLLKRQRTIVKLALFLEM